MYLFFYFSMCVCVHLNVCMYVHHLYEGDLFHFPVELPSGSESVRDGVPQGQGLRLYPHRSASLLSTHQPSHFSIHTHSVLILRPGALSSF